MRNHGVRGELSSEHEFGMRIFTSEGAGERKVEVCHLSFGTLETYLLVFLVVPDLWHDGCVVLMNVDNSQDC